MKEKEGRMYLKEALSLHLRGVKVIAGACPRLFPAIALSSLVKAVTPSAGGLTLLNEPLFILLLLALLLGVSALSGMFGGKAFSYMSSVAEEVRFGNRLFAAFSKLGEDRSKAADIRMYGQQDLARHYLQQGGGDLVDAIGRVSRGPMGLYSGLSSGVSALFTGGVYLFTCLKAWAGAFGVG